MRRERWLLVGAALTLTVGAALAGASRYRAEARPVDAQPSEEPSPQLDPTCVIASWKAPDGTSHSLSLERVETLRAAALPPPSARTAQEWAIDVILVAESAGLSAEASPPELLHAYRKWLVDHESRNAAGARSRAADMAALRTKAGLVTSACPLPLSAVGEQPS